MVQQSQAEKNRVGNYKHGRVMYIYVDKASPQGNIYVKCPNIGTAVAAVNASRGILQVRIFLNMIAISKIVVVSM